MYKATTKILDGITFVISDEAGDIEANPTGPTGLFANDTRFLSRWVLTVNGRRTTSLAVDDVHYFQSRFFVVSGTGTVYINSKLSLIRDRWICNGFHEQLTVLNHDDRPADLTIRFDAGSDFADLVEIREGLPKKGSYTTRVEDGRLFLGYRRDGYQRRTVIWASAPAEFDEHGLTFTVHLEPQGQWIAALQVNAEVIGWGGAVVQLSQVGVHRRGPEEMRQDLARWVDRAPKLACDWPALRTIYQRCLVDLAALRFSPMLAGTRSLPAGGLPWSMAQLGRDSILTSLQALPVNSELAVTTLHMLSAGQGVRYDDFREEQPGRIQQEQRYGETTAFEERPFSPYFGAADTTPLFVVLLDEYERWTGDSKLVRRMEDNARRALNWIDGYGDLMGNGYLAYQPRNRGTGVQNQCWKDTPDAISYQDGRLPGFPRATCELQGYVYDAKLRAARMARQFWGDPGYADRLEREAADLKQRFNRDFWIEDGEYFALALDADGSRVDALSSNIGHLLWSGIVDPAKCPAVVRHLLGPQLYSGWGVRTLAESAENYNPMGYHTGAVWPFDNSIIAYGLRRAGFHDEAARVASGVLEAAEFFDGQLPEVFGGYDRETTRYPVRHPNAGSPHALSTGAPLLLLRTMLGLEPYEDHLTVSPALPVSIGHIELLDIPGRWGHVDAYARGRVEVGIR